MENENLKRLLEEAMESLAARIKESENPMECQMLAKALESIMQTRAFVK